MSSQGDATLPATRRSRKSIGVGPSRGDRENATLDVGSAMGATRKKSRSKSLGPGSLDILKTGNGNRRASLAIPSGPPPRSILKPTIPILPEIPTFKPRDTHSSNESAGTKVALRTEEEQQAAAREREERERAELEKEIKDRREARRKSLANRRVSFAAEATLHTFHEVDENQDATATAASHHHQAPDSDPPSTPPDHIDDHDAESPADQRALHQRNQRRSSGVGSLYGDDDTIASTVYDSDMEHADDIDEVETEEMSGSSDSDDDGTVMTVEAEEMTSASVASMTSGVSAFDNNNSTDSLDENLRLAKQRAAATQRIDEDEEVIAGFAGWGRKPLSQSETTTQIIRQHMPPPTPDVQQRDQGFEIEMDMDDDMDMDMTKAVGGILQSQSGPQSNNQDEDVEMDMDEDMSMDVTKALGGILGKHQAQNRRKSVKPFARQQDADELGDQTMELTTAVGGIRQGRMSIGGATDIDELEDMSMEFTSAIGGLLSKGAPNAGSSMGRRRTMAAEDDGMDMDMTAAVGGILATSQPQEEDDVFEQTMAMDETMAVGGILKPASPEEARSAAKRVMELEADGPDVVYPSLTASTQETASPIPQTASQENNDTLGLSAFRGKGLRNSMPGAPFFDSSPVRSPEKDLPAKSPVRNSSPVRSSPVRSSPARSTRKSPARDSPERRTPSPARGSPRRESPARRTPSPARNTAPATKTPPSMIGSSSPVRDASPPKTTPRSVGKGRLFHQDPSTGISTPRVVLTPQGRRLSGVGADRPGLGSPRVAEIFDRRDSLQDSAAEFVPSEPSSARRTVAFADPRAMEAEVDQELRDEAEKENNRRILEREADGDREITLNLKEMIQNLSPTKKKKNPFAGRKSLMPGSARGLLGKRPAELDVDDEEEDSEVIDGVKRLKGHQGSPVKNVRLGSPPSKAETTTGRKTRSAAARGEDDTATITPAVPSSPVRAAGTPNHHGRFRSVFDDQPTNTFNFYDHTATVDADALMRRDDDDGDRIHLQDFLNLTSIRFMELTTTKRRHTVAPGETRLSLTADGKEDLSLEKCVVAGACTVPTLELYQHSCRELKKYISEGRRIVREIESETFEENPPLFREYMTATPEFKVLMDNQFKNVKTHARLLSKAMWYEWRMKLQDGLKEGLVKIAEGMDDDERLLTKQQELLSSVLPDMIKRAEELEKEHENLEAVAQEMADCDPAELEEARAELVSLDESLEEKQRKIAELKAQLEESNSGIETLTAQKQQCLDEIREADKIREECRGWSTEEISKLKARTDKIEKTTGWAITGISGTQISMTYKRQVELVFDIASFPQQSNPNHRPGPQSNIDLWYIADKREPANQSVPLTPEREFFLQSIRDRIRSVPQATTKVNTILQIVKDGWDKSCTVANYVRLLNLTFPTVVKKTGDASIAVVSSLMLVPLQTRVEAVLNLSVGSEAGEGGLEVKVVPEAKVVYGEQFNTAKLEEFLQGKIGGSVNVGGENKGWDQGMLELYKRLLVRGSRAAAAVVAVAGGEK
ncbi:putative kinetochore protein spc7 [Cercophora samala]|uniref:Kinetochore protein spc7 n=1 Tax=Cercophora samala TaxID=330535 RepID=A0AA39Z8C5_9PEZI|nr:putative kinetochore protein spc7 [Cercophora samala]